MEERTVPPPRSPPHLREGLTLLTVCATWAHRPQTPVGTSSSGHAARMWPLRVTQAEKRWTCHRPPAGFKQANCLTL